MEKTDKYVGVENPLSMANMGRAWIKGLVFIGLLISVAATIITGLGLGEGGGEAGAVGGSGEGSLGVHAGLAGLLAVFVLMHLIVNRNSIIFTLKNMFGEK